jgi:acyl-CoA synthetase (AMP-forming)/AMP-acid ligase II
MAEELLAWCRNHMANFKVPRSLEIVDALPVNAAGKVTKYVLRQRDERAPRATKA